MHIKSTSSITYLSKTKTKKVGVSLCATFTGHSLHNKQPATIILVCTMLSGSQSTSPWLYFLSGSLLPTIAYFLFQRRKEKEGNRDDDDEYEYDSDSNSDGNSDGNNDDEDCTQRTSSQSSAARDWGMRDAPYKMVLVVNQELKMGKGKIAAQCGHASVGCFKRSIRVCPNAVRAWEHTGCAKIAIKCPTEEEMRRVLDKARAKGLPAYLVEDAGRTQIAAGSRTVLGILGPTYVFDDLTAHLKLL